MKRPLGVVVLAVWCFLGAAVGLCYGAAFVWEVWREGNIVSEAEPLWERIITHPLMFVLLILFMTIFYSRLGWGLWKLENTARIGFIVLTLPTLVGWIAAEIIFYSPRPLLEWVPDLARIALLAFLLVYLFLPSTRRVFKASSDGPAPSPSFR